MRRVLIGTPSYDGRIDVWFANSLIQTVKIAEKKGIFVHAIYTSYDSLVQRARNSLFRLALQGNYDDLFFIDSDCEWEPEKSFCRDGYGGKCDLHNKDKGILIDFKGKDFNESDELKAYENHWIQLGAYNYGLNINAVQAYVCYVSRNNPGVVCQVKVTEQELSKGLLS